MKILWLSLFASSLILAGLFYPDAIALNGGFRLNLPNPFM